MDVPRAFCESVETRIAPDSLTMNLERSSSLRRFHFGGSPERQDWGRDGAVAGGIVSDEAMEAYTGERGAASRKNPAAGMHDAGSGKEGLRLEAPVQGVRAGGVGKRSELQRQLWGNFQMIGSPDFSRASAAIGDILHDLRDACKSRCLPSNAKMRAALKRSSARTTTWRARSPPSSLRVPRAAATRATCAARAARSASCECGAIARSSLPFRRRG